MAIAHIGDGSCVDTRRRLELPERFAGRFVQGHKFAGSLSGEYEPSAGYKHAGRTGHIRQRNLPFFFARQRVDRKEGTQRLTRLERGTLALDERVTFPENHWLRRELLDARLIPRCCINQTGIRV